MEKTNERNRPRVYPLIRVITLGEFALERLVTMPSTATEAPHYMRIMPEEWDNRGPALTLLKVLLCRMHRRASKSELIATIWPDGSAINTQHALDSAVSILRRRVLRTYTGESLLLTVHSAGDTTFKLSAQHALWVDADALLTLAAQSLRVAGQGQNPLFLLEKAHTFAKGEFLEDDLHCEWAHRRRHTINGARRRVLYKLVELYLKEKRIYHAEELLYSFLEEWPTDEDALCHLMMLLSEQGRRQEALQIYNYTLDVLYEGHHEPALYTQELAARIQQGVTVKEQTTNYIVTDAPNAPSFIPHDLRKNMQLDRKIIRNHLSHHTPISREIAVGKPKMFIELAAPRRKKTSYTVWLLTGLLQKIVLGISFYSIIERWHHMRMEVDKMYYGNYKFEVELDTGAEVGAHQLLVWFAEKKNIVTLPLSHFKATELLKALQEPYKSALHAQLEQEKESCRRPFKEEIADLQRSTPPNNKKTAKEKRRISELQKQMNNALPRLEADFARRALLPLDKSCFDLEILQKANHFFEEGRLLRDFYFEEANTQYISNFCRKFAMNEVYRQQVLAHEAPWMKRNALFWRNVSTLFGQYFHPTDAREYENQAYELFHWIDKHYKEILALPAYQQLQQVDNAFKPNATELDPAIRPAVELLNQIPGVTTRYSCQGVSGKVRFQDHDLLVVSEHEEYAYVSFVDLDHVAKQVIESLLPQFPHITNAPSPGSFMSWPVLRSTGHNIDFRAELFELARRVLDEVMSLQGN